MVFNNTALQWFYFVVQAGTAMILILAANTAFAGFPRLASLLAIDRYMPRQLANLGDRLAFNNGIVALAVFASILIVIFHGSVTALIALYAIGVFLSFTLSQSGMVIHWFREKGRGWQLSLLVNLLGANRYDHCHRHCHSHKISGWGLDGGRGHSAHRVDIEKN
jgi:hypothetical protein